MNSLRAQYALARADVQDTCTEDGRKRPVLYFTEKI
jgi:hypothetical protein